MDVGNRNEDLPLQSPYYAGARYSLQFIPNADSGQTRTLEVTVLEVFTPTTISPVLKVKVESTSPMSLPSTAILKLYDRRFANDLRAFHDAPKPSATSEESFRAFMSKEGSRRSLDDWKTKIFDDQNADIETPPEETEAFLAVLLASYHRNEVHVYERLAFMQGNSIPLFFGQTRFKISDTHPDTIDVDVPGILIEYVEGTGLDKLPASAVSPTLCQACVDIVLTVGDHDVLNQDVRLQNFIVPSSAESGRTVVMIDFAQARLRENDEDDDQWKQAKWTIDEEGAVGYVLRKKFGWDYQPTFRYLVPAEE